MWTVTQAATTNNYKQTQKGQQNNSKEAKENSLNAKATRAADQKQSHKLLQNYTPITENYIKPHSSALTTIAVTTSPH